MRLPRSIPARRVVVPLCAVLLAAGGCADEVTPPAAVLLPPGAVDVVADAMVQGAHSAYYGPRERQRFVIDSDAGWAAYWSALTARHGASAPARPVVDFTTHQVVAVAMGARGTGGYVIEVARVADAPDARYVLVRETSPGDGCMVTMAETAPLHIVRVPRRTATVVFVEQAVTSHCR